MLADGVRVDGNIKVPTVQQMRQHGKRILELKHSIPHTRVEMNANAPRGIVKVTGPMLLTSVKNATAGPNLNWQLRN